jgi:hypothetical protein
MRASNTRLKRVHDIKEQAESSGRSAGGPTSVGSGPQDVSPAVYGGILPAPCAVPNASLVPGEVRPCTFMWRTHLKLAADSGKERGQGKPDPYSALLPAVAG